MLLATRKMIGEIDAFAENTLGIKGQTLMLNAGKSAADRIKKHLRDNARVCVLCGQGKNGGDGYVIAEQLFDADHYVTVFESDSNTRDESSEYYRTKLKKKLKNIYSISDRQKLTEACEGAEIIIDALFGVGFHGEMPECEAYAVKVANASRALRVAVDIPSGAEADCGRVGSVCFRADRTMTMEYVKRGMLLYPAREFVGKIEVCSIGVDRAAVEEQFAFIDKTAERSMIEKYILSRPADSHKGTYGRLMLVCGSDYMTGAAVLACEGALRMGVGLCELVCTESVARVVAALCPEVVYTLVPPVSEWDNGVYEKILLHSVEADAMVVGCGLGEHKNVQRLVELISSLVGCPLLLDADGINCLDGSTELLKRAQREIVITPHPKEFARLVYRDISEVLYDRYRSASQLCEECNITVLLKSASTVIACPDGTRYINTTGNSGLAKGGSGDVLSGMIGALLAQGIPTSVSAALGAHVHGAAADMLATEYGEAGMLPRDIPAAAARYIASLR